MSQTARNSKAAFRKEMQAIRKEFQERENDRAAKREKAVGILSLDEVRSHRQSRQALVLSYGRLGKQVMYSPEDLDKFAKTIKKQQKNFNSKTAGVRIAELIENSLQEDWKRAGEVRNAIAYMVVGNVVHFRVSSVSEQGKTHQVKIRLEEWKHQATGLAHNLSATYLTAVRNAIGGRVSFDCSCGRHQFWYRYLASIGNFAVEPTESGFPKIRNPSLTGCCCKHALKALKTIMSPAYTPTIARLMQNQSGHKKGFDSNVPIFVNEREFETMGRSSRATKLSTASQMEKAIARAKKLMPKFQKQAKPYDLKPRNKPASKDMSQEKRDALLFYLRGALDMSKSMDADKETVFKMVAKQHEVSVEALKQLADKHNVK